MGMRTINANKNNSFALAFNVCTITCIPVRFRKNRNNRQIRINRKTNRKSTESESEQNFMQNCMVDMKSIHVMALLRNFLREGQQARRRMNSEVKTIQQKYSRLTMVCLQFLETSIDSIQNDTIERMMTNNDANAATYIKETFFNGKIFYQIRFSVFLDTIGLN